MQDQAGDVTRKLLAFGAGKREALDELLPVVYDELRRIAAGYLGRERSDHTLQPTALVHEAYLRLVDQRSVDWRNRAQFFGLAAGMMRRVLVNHALAKKAEKRGAGERPVSADETIIALDELNLDLLALNEALMSLADLDMEKAHLVEMKFFGGMTTAEIAEVTGKPVRSIERDWSFSRSWLYKRLTDVAGGTMERTDD